MRPRHLPLKQALLLFCIGTLAEQGHGQTFADTLWARTPDTLWLNRNNLVPFSELVDVGGQSWDAGHYEIDYYNGWLAWKRPLPTPDSVRVVVQYRTFGFAANPIVRLRTTTEVVDTATGQTYMQFVQPQGPETSALDEFSLSQLQSSGSLARSITLGTNRDLAVNSDFRLQLEGELGDGLNITAAITDQNIPIQPSGTTQQLSDFDRVFIQLRRNRNALVFGDFEIQQQNTHFMNVYRNVLGVKYAYTGQRLQSSVSLTVSKGRFHTNSFQGQNNRQGPYRLQGRQNERFIIILAGSERVYVNGRAMQRGEDQDYVIEYNTGEITFMARRVIDVNTRIVVDFEYTDRNYARSLLFMNHQATLDDSGRVRLRVSYGREADDPNAPIDLVLQAEERQALRAAGDDPALAFTSGVDTVGWDRAQILYASIDTLVNGIRHGNVLVYSTDSMRAVYRVIFANVGAGRGDYIQQNATINGNVFQWVAPDSAGNRRGEFMPIRLLPLPRKLEVWNMGLEWQISRRLRFYTENTTSSEDGNRLSPQGDADNRDWATRSGLVLAGAPIAGRWQVGADAHFQYVGQRFQNLDRVFQREYGREWNFNDLAARQTERLTEGGVTLALPNKHVFRLGAGFRAMGDSLVTNRQTLDWTGTDSASVMGENKFSRIVTTNNLQGRSSEWLRNEGDVYAVFWRHLRIGSEVWLEDKRETSADSIVDGSFRFYDFRPYVRWVGSPKLQADFSFQHRTDYNYADAAVRLRSTTLTPQLRLAYQPKPSIRLANTTTIQHFRVHDKVFLEEQALADNRMFLTNLQASYNSKNGLIQSNSLFEILTEQVARRQEIFVQVAPGLGQYEWTDFNENGVQDLDEFQLSVNPLLANFVKVLSPTPTLFPAVSVRAGLSFQLNLKRVFPSPWPTALEPIRNLTTLTSLRADQRRQTNPGQPQRYWFAFGDEARLDTTLLSSQFNLRHDFFFFRNSPKGDVALSLIELQTRQFLNSGTEVRQNRSWTLRPRYNFSPSRSVEASTTYGFRINEAQVLANRNFHINFVKFNPLFNNQLSRKLRLSTGYEFQWKENLTDSLTVNSDVRVHKVIVDMRMNFSGRNNIFGKLELLNVGQRGVPNNNANFELLEGNQPGRNAVWNLYLTYFLTRALELSVMYEGRASQARPPLHSGRMQLRAIF